MSLKESPAFGAFDLKNVKHFTSFMENVFKLGYETILILNYLY